MSDPQSALSVADREAAEWHVRLGERPVSAAALSEFRDWRQAPENAEAYRRLEAVWRSAGALAPDPDLQALTQETLRRSRRPKAGKKVHGIIPTLGAVGAVLAVALAVCFWTPDRNSYGTSIGEQRLVRLEDGTQVRLDTDTRIKVRYEKAQRSVILDKGQALFVVAHDAARPFRVSAGDTVVTALGTTFDVRRETAGARVTLVNGSVAVTDAASGADRRWRLSPGQQVQTSGVDVAPRNVDAAVATSWSEGRLVFNGVPLREAVTEVNRYLPEKIVLSAGRAETVPVNGSFAAGDREAFVSAVSDLFGLSAHPLPDGGVRLTAPSVGG